MKAIFILSLGAVWIAPMAAHLRAEERPPAIEFRWEALDALPREVSEPPLEQTGDSTIKEPPSSDDVTQAENTTAYTLRFEAGSTVLSTSAIESLSNLAVAMEAADIRARIRAHGGVDAPQADGNRLALRRARAARDFIVGKGIAENRLLIDITTTAGTDQNQVDITILDR